MLKRGWLRRLSLASLLTLMLAGGALAVRSARQQRRSDAEGEAAVQASQAVRAKRSREVALPVYDGKLADGWADWGWGPHELPSSGPAKVQFRGFGGIILRHELLTQRFGGLSFRFKAPHEWQDFLSVALKSSAGSEATLGTVALNEENTVPAADGWRAVWIGFEELNPDGEPFDRIVISARRSVEADWVLLDKVALTKLDPNHAPLSAPARNAELGILCRAGSHAISPLIYGSALGDWASGQTAQRIGGNPTTRANFDLKAWNVANDWFFENTPSTDNGELIDTAAAHGAGTALTVPMIGWVAKDTTSVGFPAAKFPKQRKFDANRGAGDGFAADGQPLKPGPPTETSVPAPPELIARWVRELRDKDKARAKRALQTYILDNEPSLWSTTHRDVHPQPLTYDELLDRTVRYGTAIRNADPDTLIAGPAEWGWLGYMYSGSDLAAGKFLRPDRRAHGDIPLIPWYLQKLAEHEKSTGVRLLDVLDVHYYPANEKLLGDDARVDAEGAALRIRSTRSLWDASYRDESWIGENIRLIPRMKEWVQANYPGLQLSIGEWSFGGEKHISGALATAEALGRFGQQGLYSAYFWDGPKTNSSTFWAFRAFRNFDARGGHFLDHSLITRETETVSLFASADSGASHLVAVAINRDPLFAATALVRLENCASLETVRAFAYGRSSSQLSPSTVTAVDHNSFRATIPPYSLVVFDVNPGEADGGDGGK